MTFTDDLLAQLMQSYFWPFLRIGSLLMAAPLYSAQAVPPRIRLLLALALTVSLVPVLPAPAPLGLFGSGWWLAFSRELILGVGLGLVLQLVFEGVMLAGELISYGMGLGFAQLVDPLHGASAPMLGQFYQVCATLLFFSMGGHLHIVELVADSFRAAPSGPALPALQSFSALAAFGGLAFRGAVQIALPAVVALLLVNIGFGVMNRSAPALNMMTIGFPLSLSVGLLVLRYALPQLQGVLVGLLDQAWLFAHQWLRA